MFVNLETYQVENINILLTNTKMNQVARVLLFKFYVVCFFAEQFYVLVEHQLFTNIFPVP